MANSIAFFIACILALGTLQVINSEEIVLSEEQLVDSCTETCDELPTLYDEHGCTKISKCQLSRTGWTRGFVRCDFCSCQCEKKTGDTKDVLVETKNIMLTEDDLFDTCTGTCSKSGLVKSNFKGCQKVENCRQDKEGWTRGFVRCDYCTCSCVNTREAASYKLVNVKYDTSDLAKKEGKPKAIAKTVLKNKSDKEQTVTRVLTFDETSKTSVTTTKSLQTGLAVSVAGSGGVPGLGTVSTTVTASLTAGFTTAAGEEKTSTVSDSVRVSVVVPPHSKISANIIGHSVKINIPFSADLVTTYKDGITKTKHTTGVYNNVQAGQFRVKYSAAKPLISKKRLM